MKKLIMGLVLGVLVCGCSPVVHVGAGVTIVRNIPEQKLTGHEQFHINIEIEQPLSDNLSIISGWTHVSNGAQIGIGRRPNSGLDFFGARFDWRIPIKF